MSARILQINYRLMIPLDEFRARFGPVAHDVAKVPGLRWKLWLAAPDRAEGGGVYLFDDDASLQAYLDGPIITGIRAHPAFAGITIQTFDVLQAGSALTRGPLGADAPPLRRAVLQ